MLSDLILKSIDKYSLDGKYICTYNSAFEISDSNDMRSRIYSCCNKKIKSCFGFQWR
jgi:hypothetical protein